MELLFTLVIIAGVVIYAVATVQNILARPKKMIKAIELLEKNNLMGTNIPFVESYPYRTNMVMTYRLKMGDVFVEAIIHGVSNPENMKGIPLTQELFSNNTRSFRVYHKNSEVYSHGY